MWRYVCHWVVDLKEDRMKAVPVDKFGEHVQHMHADRDKWFEQEYNVSIEIYAHYSYESLFIHSTDNRENSSV